jgi:hypothetical protein
MAQLPEYELMAKMSEELDRLRQQNAQLLRALENLLPIAVAAIDESGGDPEQFYVIQQAQAAIAAAEGGR